MRRFRKKPIVIEAVRFTGRNYQTVFDFIGDGAVGKHSSSGRIYLPTLEGTMEVSPGDWVIRGVKGEYYPCKPDIFETSYEPVEDSA